jgi:transcription initiation factor IIE alpha subunit
MALNSYGCWKDYIQFQRAMLERYKTWGGTISCAGRQLLEVDNKRSKEKLMEEINQIELRNRWSFSGPAAITGNR